MHPMDTSTWFPDSYDVRCDFLKYVSMDIVSDRTVMFCKINLFALSSAKSCDFIKTTFIVQEENSNEQPLHRLSHATKLISTHIKRKLSIGFFKVTFNIMSSRRVLLSSPGSIPQPCCGVRRPAARCTELPADWARLCSWRGHCLERSCACLPKQWNWTMTCEPVCAHLTVYTQWEVWTCVGSGIVTAHSLTF